jgi:hypothetical protein
MPIRRVRLIHWNEPEAARLAVQLRSLGYQVLAGPMAGAEFRAIRTEPPDAFVIDLSRIPSQGRDLALGLRSQKGTRGAALVLVGGEQTFLVRVRTLLPDATYTTWGRIGPALKRALERPVVQPVVPPSALAGYSGTPLPRKLGIREGSTVALVNAPTGFEKTLSGLPPGVVIRSAAKARSDLTLWFVTSRKTLEASLARMTARAAKGGLWIVWPKKASGVPSDLTEDVVRQAGLASGIVDFKVCAVDSTWSGLRFSWRDGKPPGPAPKPRAVTARRDR